MSALTNQFLVKAGGSGGVWVSEEEEEEGERGRSGGEECRNLAGAFPKVGHREI